MNHVAMQCRYLPTITVVWPPRSLNQFAYRSTDVAAVVCEVFGVTLNDLKSPRRTRKLFVPRHAFCALMKEFTSYSYPQIGATLGNRDHTTILHAVRRAALLYAHDVEFMAMMDKCRLKLRQLRGE